MPQAATIRLQDVLPRKAHARGLAHGRSVLTEAKVRKIRELARGGGALSRIATAFGVSRGAVRKVVARKTWTHIAD